MTDLHNSTQPPDVLDELVDQLLECGAVLSQIISHMVHSEGSGACPPDTAPIPEIAHSLIRSVIGDVRRKHSVRDVKVAARIVNQVTEAIGDEIFMVPIDFVDRYRTDTTD